MAPAHGVRALQNWDASEASEGRLLPRHLQLRGFAECFAKTVLGRKTDCGPREKEDGLSQFCSPPATHTIKPLPGRQGCARVGSLLGVGVCRALRGRACGRVQCQAIHPERAKKSENTLCQKQHTHTRRFSSFSRPGKTQKRLRKPTRRARVPQREQLSIKKEIPKKSHVSSGLETTVAVLGAQEQVHAVPRVPRDPPASARETRENTHTRARILFVAAKSRKEYRERGRAWSFGESRSFKRCKYRPVSTARCRATLGSILFVSRSWTGTWRRSSSPRPRGPPPPSCLCCTGCARPSSSTDVSACSRIRGVSQLSVFPPFLDFLSLSRRERATALVYLVLSKL